jgi:hypothetical protein
MASVEAKDPRPEVATPDLMLLFGQDYARAFVALADDTRHTLTAVSYRLGPINYQTENPFQNVLKALERAAKRGVRVAIYFCPWGIPHGQRTAAGHLHTRLTDAGIRIHHANMNCRLHAKIVCFDDSAFIIGSHNLTNSSLISHGELSVVHRIKGLPPQVLAWLQSITDPAHA